MADLNEIKKRLDILYDKYKKNKSQLSNPETKEASALIVKMTVSSDSSISLVVNELVRFSADICNLYFTNFLQTVMPSIEVLDELISTFIATDINRSKSQYYIQKYVYIVTSVIKGRSNIALESKQLPKLVTIIARSAMLSEKQRKKFQNMVKNSNGVIYLLDFSGTDKNNLKNIWNITTKLYPDLSKVKYGNYIKEWAEKYGFIDSKSNESEKQTVVTESCDIKTKYEKIDEIKGKTIKEEVNPIVENLEDFLSSVNQKLCEDISSKITAESESIKSTLNNAVLPLCETMNNFQKELNRVSELTTLNISLQNKITELEQQLKEAGQRICVDLDSKAVNEAEKNILKEKIRELDEKLKEAYSINSRESSLEAEKIKNDISKSLTLCYEDWIEYEMSDYSEENYESLQAIIKRIFRAVEKNGINLKGNNE